MRQTDTILKNLFIDNWDNLEKLQADLKNGDFLKNEIVEFGLVKIYTGLYFPNKEHSLLLQFKDYQFTKKQINFLPSGNGFNLIIPDEITYGSSWLALYCTDKNIEDAFIILCLAVYYVLERNQTNSQSEMCDAVINQIILLQRLMKKNKGLLLSSEEERGLFGELLVVQKLMRLKIANSTIIDSWKGPLKGIHDFDLGVFDIEVKTTKDKSLLTFNIQSLEQLDIIHNSLYFQLFQLTEGSDSDLSLTDLVEEIRSKIENKIILEKFDSLLLEVGFSVLTEHFYTRTFHIKTDLLYKVDDDFPRLTKPLLNQRIIETSYKIDLTGYEGQQEKLSNVVLGVKDEI